jgi:acetylglutamate kinase
MQTRDVVIELLSHLGSSREAREYLRKFSSKDSTQFAVIKVGGEVIQDHLSQLASSLCFLHTVGLFPIILHGAGRQLNQALADAGIPSEKIGGIRVTTPEVMAVVRPVIYRQNLILVEALEAFGIRTRALQHGIFECEYEHEKQLGLVGRVIKVHLESIRSAVQSGSLPIVTCLGESSSGQMMNINADVAAANLVLAIKPYKIIFITPTGGLLDEQGRVISAINLKTDFDRLMDSEWVHSGMRLKLQQINEMLEQLPDSSSVSITSAANLTRELFTYRGAGTLIRKGEGFKFIDQIDDNQRTKLKELIELCFGKQLTVNYFQTIRLQTLIWAESGRGTAVIDCGANGVPYMDKFAVTPAAQGEGLGSALWQQIRNRYPRLYWRSRGDNPVNSWYNQQADFAIRRGKWQVFGYGLSDLTEIGQLVNDAAARTESWDNAGQLQEVPV